MNETPADQPTDPRQRYERALLGLSERLHARATLHRLVAEDRRGGDRLALVAEVDGALVELTVDRRRATAGRAWLAAESRAAAADFVETIGGAADQVSRLATVQRGCLARVEALAERLAADHDRLRLAFPEPALHQLRRAFPGACAMVGLAVDLRPLGLGAAIRTRSEALQFTPVYAAAIQTEVGRRAARWVAATRVFALPKRAQREVERRLGTQDAPDLAAYAIAAGAPGRAGGDDVGEIRLRPVDAAADCSCDVLGSLFDVGDCGPGCDFDGGCFDVSPDCVSLDCSPDCGF